MFNILFPNNNQRNSSVLRINLSYIYDLSKSIYPLTFLRYNKDHDRIFTDANYAYQMLTYIHIMYNLRSSWDAVERLKDLLAVYLTKYLENNKKGEQTAVDINELEQIADTALELELLLRSELAIQPSYLVTPKGGYDVDILTLTPKDAFPPNLLQKVPEAEYDITECAKALAFELPTACGFHLMRVFEAVVKKYYLITLQDGNLLDKNGRNKSIGILIQEMISNRTPDKEKDNKINAVIDILKSIKDNYRNPLIHLEINMKIQEVLVLFGVIYGAISLMLEKLDIVEVSNERT